MNVTITFHRFGCQKKCLALVTSLEYLAKYSSWSKELERIALVAIMEAMGVITALTEKSEFVRTTEKMIDAREKLQAN